MTRSSTPHRIPVPTTFAPSAPALQPPVLGWHLRSCLRTYLTLAWALMCTCGLSLPMRSLAEPLSFTTAEAGKGYSKIFSNLNAMCGSKVPMQEVNTSGGLDNLVSLSEKTSTIGIAQYDTWLALSKGDEAIGRLKGLATVSYNLMHIVVLAGGISKVENKQCVGGKEVFGKCIWGEWKDNVNTTLIKTELQLKGLKVAVVGAAQGLARSLLNDKLELNLTLIDVPPLPGKPAETQAIDKLKSGEVQAVIFMGIHPEAAVAALKNGDKPNEKFSLTSFYGSAPSGFKLIKKNYKNINAYNVTFLAVPNILWVRSVDPGGDTGKQINELKNCFSANLQTLQDKEGFESGWAEASLSMPDDVPVWIAPTAPPNAAAKAKK